MRLDICRPFLPHYPQDTIESQTIQSNLLLYIGVFFSWCPYFHPDAYSQFSFAFDPCFSPTEEHRYRMIFPSAIFSQTDLRGCSFVSVKFKLQLMISKMN